MTDTISDRVHRGAQVLDWFEPDWWSKVSLDPNQIDMDAEWLRDGVGDILSHVFSLEQDELDMPGYYLGLNRLGISEAGGVLYGFAPATCHALYEEGHDERQALVRCWLMEVNARWEKEKERVAQQRWATERS